MSNRDCSVTPIFHNLDCAYSERLSPASITSSSNGSDSSWTGRRSTKGKLRPGYKRRVKPPHSYIEMIGMAIRSSPTGRLTLRDITNFMYDKFECFRGQYVGWKNSVRHNLSASTCFTKNLRDPTRPYGKDNYWAMNVNCDHCKNNIENEAACKRILAKSKHIPVNRYNNNNNNNLPLNLVIQPRSPASSDSASDVSSEPHTTTTDNQTKRLCHPPTNMYTNYQRTQQSQAESYYYGNYYDQHYSAPRHQYRYHPYTASHTSHRQQGRYSTVQQPGYLDDLATLEDLYVPATDIDLSMYNDAEGSGQRGKDGKLHAAQPFIKDQQQQGLVQYTLYHPNASLTYDTNYQYYGAGYIPTSYQYSHNHYENQKVSPPVNSKTDSYVHPYPYGFVSTTAAAQHQSYPSSPSPSSNHSSVSYESDSDSTVFLPSEALALLYDRE